MKAIELGLDVLAEKECQEPLLDFMQTREQLYDLLGYVPSDPRANPPLA